MTASRMRLISYLSPGFPRSLFELFGELVDADVDFDESRSGPADGDDPFADGRADLGWICSTSYVGLALASDDPTVRLGGVAWVPDDPDTQGRPVYFGDVVVQADSPIRTFDDLAGARVGCNDEVSLSGHYSLRFALDDRSLDPASHLDMVFTGAHHTSLDRLVAGELDAAVIDSVVRHTRSRRDAAVASLRVVHRLGPWPVQPLVVSTSLPCTDALLIRERLLRARTDPRMVAALAEAGLTSLVEVGSDHYEPVRAAMARLG